MRRTDATKRSTAAQFESLVLRKFLKSSLKNVGIRDDNLPLFMVAASCETCPVSVIYHLLRRNVHDVLSGNNGISKKRKLGDSN